MEDHAILMSSLSQSLAAFNQSMEAAGLEDKVTTTNTGAYNLNSNIVRGLEVNNGMKYLTDNITELFASSYLLGALYLCRLWFFVIYVR